METCLKPILFSAPMVNAILEGRKTQTRRVVKNLDYIQDWDENDPTYGPFFEDEYGDSRKTVEVCPYGEVGDRLWVRETWGAHLAWDNEKPSVIECPMGSASIWYAADGRKPAHIGKTRPSIFMPQWASRIALEITDVRVERVQDINAGDVEAEGIDVVSKLPLFVKPDVDHERMANFIASGLFQKLWDSINSTSHPWDSNPWVWVVEFKRI